MAHFSFACRSVGGSCEWAMQADSPQIILARFAEHQKCAHHLPQLTPELVRSAEAAIRTV
jgi:predicted small metal-binding protein